MSNEDIDISEEFEERSSRESFPMRLDDINNFSVDSDGKVSMRVTLDRDQVECCVCYSPMTGAIYRCRSTSNIAHNLCSDCEWQIRRIKENNGHVKPPRCPLCKAQGHFIRNVELEGQLGQLSDPCENAKFGCQKRFFRWNKDGQREHLSCCLFETAKCPICNDMIQGVQAFEEHLASGSCGMLDFVKLEHSLDRQKHKILSVKSHESSYFYNEQFNYAILFIWRDQYFDCAVFSTDASAEESNHQCQIHFTNMQELINYRQNLSHQVMASSSIHVPIRHSMSVNITSLFIKNPKAKIQYGKFFVGEVDEPIVFHVEFSTLCESLTQGCTLDCRDYLGKWYEAEVLKVATEDMASSAHDLNDSSKVRKTRIFVHYLGYSSSYDEWFDLASDTCRIAKTGTHTVGPNLRTIRRSHLNQQQYVECPDMRRQRANSHAQPILLRHHQSNE